jgi:predicted lipoprotein with Yx(FWY)xxD motif
MKRATYGSSSTKHWSTSMSSRPLAMTRARSGLTILASLALLLGACSSSSGSSAGASTGGDSSAPASAAAGGDATVLAADTELGGILTDADGNTIYYFANDTAGVSSCADDCLTNWPAVEATGTPTAGDGVSATLGTITRDDGTTQLTVNEFPAYYFSGDAAPGDTNGQGQGDVWWVFGVDGAPIEG